MSEIKIAIEDVTQCPGRCDGCLLSARERSGQESSVSFEWTKLAEFVLGFHELRGASKKLILNFGQGDHSALSVSELLKRAKLLNDLGRDNYEAFFTIAAAVKGDRFRSSVSRMGDIMSKYVDRIGIDLVFDPTYYDSGSFWESYSKNIEHVYSVFGRVDLNVNIGPDTVKSCTAIEFDDFVSGNSFANATINYVPTKHTGYLLASSANEIFDWMRDLLEVRKTRRSAYGLTFNNAMRSSAVDFYGLNPTNASKAIISSFCDQLYVDGAGDVYFTQSLIGDYPLSDRMGFDSIGNISGFDFSGLESSARGVFRGLYRSALMRPSCAGCPWMTNCIAGGQTASVGALGEFRDREKECLTGVSRLWPIVDKSQGASRAPEGEGRWTGSRVMW